MSMCQATLEEAHTRLVATRPLSTCLAPTLPTHPSLAVAAAAGAREKEEGKGGGGSGEVIGKGEADMQESGGDEEGYTGGEWHRDCGGGVKSRGGGGGGGGGGGLVSEGSVAGVSGSSHAGMPHAPNMSYDEALLEIQSVMGGEGSEMYSELLVVEPIQVFCLSFTSNTHISLSLSLSLTHTHTHIHTRLDRIDQQTYQINQRYIHNN